MYAIRPFCVRITLREEMKPGVEYRKGQKED